LGHGVYLPRLVLIAQAVLLLEHGHADRQTDTRTRKLCTHAGGRPQRHVGNISSESLKPCTSFETNFQGRQHVVTSIICQTVHDRYCLNKAARLYTSSSRVTRVVSCI